MENNNKKDKLEKFGCVLKILKNFVHKIQI